MNGNKLRHVVLVPWTEQGHVNPMMQLAQYIRQQEHVKVTFVVTEHVHNRLQQAGAKSDNEIEMLVIPDNIPEEEHNKRTTDMHTVEALRQNMTPLLLRELQSCSVSCIIYDAGLWWVNDIAKTLAIPNILSVATCSVATLSIFYHLSSLISTGHVHPLNGSIPSSVLELTIPGLPSLPNRILPWNLEGRDDHLQITMFNLMKDLGDNIKNAPPIMFNSFYELEETTIQALSSVAKFEVLPLGPLLMLNTRRNEINVATTTFWAQDHNCIDWLDTKEASSVLYISFGSVTIVNVEQLHTLALGIEESQCSFLWVLRPNLIDGTLAKLPSGFVERTKDRGLIVSWAPQPFVLSHPSIGAFLTHCGWNSTMEAISNGVPMLTWPYFGDQKLNCHYILNEWRIGKSIFQEDEVLSQCFIKNAIQCIMGGEDQNEVRKNIMLLKEKARLAIEKGMEILNKKIFNTDYV